MQASRKRPLPSSTAPAAVIGIDTLLAKYARHLPPGGTVTVRLVKGPTTSSSDPLAASRAARAAAKAAQPSAQSSGASSGADSDCGSPGERGGRAAAAKRVPELRFPRMAKFPETVTQPDFSGALKDGRMYEEDVPKVKDESDEDEYRNGEPVKKKKRRWRRNDPRPRRWVVQDKKEFVERLRRKRLKQAGGAGDEDEASKLSNEYHGVAEFNTSKYVTLSVAPQGSVVAAAAASTPSDKVASEQLLVRPVYGFHTFSQPNKVASLSMEEAEHAIEKQRQTVTRYMMHGKLSASSDPDAAAVLASGKVRTGAGIKRSIGSAPKAMSRARLLGRLGAGAEDEDDVMGDVRFSSRSGGGASRARRELVSSLADDGTRMDGDGVLAGSNDAVFGGRSRFARVAVGRDGADKKGSKGGKGRMSTGFEAGAMEEGFYQRDVAAEYEALDYDASEQFDNDDVNVGEDEMMDDGGGYGGDFQDSGDDMLDSDEDVSDDDGLKGMASKSGLKKMLAKAQGGSPVPKAAADAKGSSSGRNSPVKGDAAANGAANGGGDGTIDRMLDAAKKTAEEMEKKAAEDGGDKKKAPSPSSLSERSKAVVIEKDKDGKRLMTLEAVRREIWLNNGAIKSKSLMKKFDVTKKNPERQALFKSIVLELCNMKKDADGNKLVLKQHYSKIVPKMTPGFD